MNEYNRIQIINKGACCQTCGPVLEGLPKGWVPTPESAGGSSGNWLRKRVIPIPERLPEAINSPGCYPWSKPYP